MKKVLIMLCALCMGFAYADNVPANKIVSSKEYVDDQLADKQTIFGANANNVAVFTDDPGVITPKPVTETLTGNGVSNTDLPTVGAVNSGLDTKQDKIGVKDVPNEYTQLEYIESTGTQYIDTGYVPTATTRIEVDLSFTSDTYAGSGGNTFFGTSNYAINFGSDAGQAYILFPWLCRYGSSGCGISSFSINASLKTTRQTVVLDAKNKVARYGTVSQTLSQTQSSASGSIYLFGIHNSDGSALVYSRNAGMFVYAARIYENDVLVRDFIPARRNSNGVIGMYDTVTGTFFTNSGTGTFIAGPAVGGAPGAVVTYTDTPGTLGAKGIYQDTGTYADQMDTLIDAGTFNAALAGALDSEFVCANRPDAYDPVSGNCWLWEINSTGVLPFGYTELEYIERNNTHAYIDTGVYPTANFEMYVDAMISSGQLPHKFFGTTTDSISVTWYSSTMFASGIGNLYSNGGISIPGFNSKFHIGISPKWVLRYDGTYKTLDRPYSSPSGTFALFYSGSNVQGRIYNAQLYDGDILTFDGIPARRNSDDVIGVYDIVNNRFLTNAGTGTFVAGPDKNNNYLPQNQ